MPNQNMEPKAVVKAAFEALNERDREQFVQLLAEDATHHTPGGAHRGRNAYVESEFGPFDAFPDQRYDIQDILADERLVAVSYTVSGTFEGESDLADPTGETYENDAVEIFEVENGQIQESRAFVDRLGTLEQLGLLNDWQIRNQYLSVINRVLRHNMRNDMNAIAGYAEMIMDENEPAVHAQTIKDIADRLISFGEKAHSLQEDAVDRDLTPESINVRTIIDSVVDDVRDTVGSATFSTEIPDDSPMVVTDGTLLRRGLSELVENAVLHNDLENPHVRVFVREPDTPADHLNIRVTDNGPGIPEAEIEAINQQSESPLVHGSGVGLWAAKWVIERLDGELAFMDNQPRGTIVQITLTDIELN